MSPTAIPVNALPAYRPLPGHTPSSRNDRVKRVHRYCRQLATVASSQLQQALLTYAEKKDGFGQEGLAEAAKQYSQAEFLPAVKEILCVWIYLEAVDQGGETMPQWLMNYFKLSLFAADYLIEQPASASVMQAYADLSRLDQLVAVAAENVAVHLGLGERAAALAPYLVPLFENSRALRQHALKQSLTQEAIEL